MNTPEQNSHKELEARLTTILSIAHGVGENRHPLNHQILVSKCMTAIQDYTNQAVRQSLLDIGMLAHKYEGENWHAREMADLVDSRLAELEGKHE